MSSSSQAKDQGAATEPSLPQADRIYVDNSNLAELKMTCDEAVERILTRGPSMSPDGKDESNGAPPSPGAASSSTLAPFKASHFHTDLRLVLGFSASAIMIGTTLWAYFIEKEWKKNKHACAIAVVLYAILSAIQTADSYWQGHVIFTGKRKMLSKRIEIERLKISSPPLSRASIKKEQKAQDGRPLLTPPTYTLHIDYTRKSNGGKSLLGSKKDKIELGHMGEWFTQEGEFIETIFEERLASGLAKAFGQ